MISPASRLLWLAAVLIVPLCAGFGWLPSFSLPALLLVLLLIGGDALRGRRLLSRLEVASGSSIRCFKGRQCHLSLSVKGRSALLPEVALALDWPLGLEAVQAFLRLGRESIQSIRFEFLPASRGSFQISLCSASALSPWKLWHVSTGQMLAVDVRVFPDLAREPAARMLLSQRSGGLRVQPLIGRGREFERLREYAHGDTFDEISWKATARRNRPVVRVSQIERTQDVYAILDSSRLSARHDALDQFVSAALTLALSAENGGDKFGLITFSDRVDHFIPAARGRGHFARCRNAIYNLQCRRVSPDFAELFTFIQLRIRRRALLLFLTDLNDPLLAETFVQNAPLLSRRHVVVVNRLETADRRPLFSGDIPATEDAILDRLASHLAWVRLEDLETSLRRVGIRVFSLRLPSASGDLVRHYQAIRREQLL